MRGLGTGTVTATEGRDRRGCLPREQSKYINQRGGPSRWRGTALPSLPARYRSTTATGTTPVPAGCPARLGSPGPRHDSSGPFRLFLPLHLAAFNLTAVSAATRKPVGFPPRAPFPGRGPARGFPLRPAPGGGGKAGVPYGCCGRSSPPGPGTAGPGRRSRFPPPPAARTPTWPPPPAPPERPSRHRPINASTAGNPASYLPPRYPPMTAPHPFSPIGTRADGEHRPMRETILGRRAPTDIPPPSSRPPRARCARARPPRSRGPFLPPPARSSRTRRRRRALPPPPLLPPLHRPYRPGSLPRPRP